MSSHRLWDYYVFRRGPEVRELWDDIHARANKRVLYIAGMGFDVRAVHVCRQYVDALKSAGGIGSAECLLIGFPDYQLTQDLIELTEENANTLAREFSQIGSCHTIGSAGDEGEDQNTGHVVRKVITDVLSRISDHTDIVLDVSSLPRVFYIALMTAILTKLIPDKAVANATHAGGVNLQVIVAEDPALDAGIRAEDPSADPVLVPGFAGAIQLETAQDWPMVWFPILGEGRVSQFLQILNSSLIRTGAEICPVIPHPAKNLRRGDKLLIEYREQLFDKLAAPVRNTLYVHESNPFEAYRQLVDSMERYEQSMSILGGCQIVVTPLGSKLLTLGAGLACFQIRQANPFGSRKGVAIPHAEPMRYVASAQTLKASRPEICCMVLTGEAYEAPAQACDAP